MLKGKLNKMNQVLDIVKLNKFNILKKEDQEFGKKIKNLNCENRRLGHIAEILKDPNDVSEYIINLYSFIISKDKIDQVISVVLSKLAKKDIQTFQHSVKPPPILLRGELKLLAIFQKGKLDRIYIFRDDYWKRARLTFSGGGGRVQFLHKNI